MNRFTVLSLTIGSLFFCVVGCQHTCPVDPDQRSVTIDEIDAGGKLAFDSSRLEILKSIAARPRLSPIEQEHLVCVAVRQLRFDDSREQVLNTLIDNPDFAPQGKAEILKNLDALSFDHAKTQLIKRMEGRGKARTEPRED